MSNHGRAPFDAGKGSGQLSAAERQVQQVLVKGPRGARSKQARPARTRGEVAETLESATAANSAEQNGIAGF